MSGRSSGGSELEKLHQRIARWRAEHGGRGVRWPPEMWSAAIAVARVEGVAPVAKRLGLGRERLSARLARAKAATSTKHARPSAFVEFDARQVCPRSHTTIRFEAGDGSKVELELGDGDALDLVALVQAFWRRGG